jgi:hypothetical protein
MSIFDMFSGRKQRIMMMQQILSQEALQAEQRKREEEMAALAQEQYAQQKALAEQQIQADKAERKKLTTEQSIARLGGAVGYRSLLSGRKGGGGFGPRGMLDAA